MFIGEDTRGKMKGGRITRRTQHGRGVGKTVRLGRRAMNLGNYLSQAFKKGQKDLWTVKKGGGKMVGGRRRRRRRRRTKPYMGGGWNPFRPKIPRYGLGL